MWRLFPVGLGRNDPDRDAPGSRGHKVKKDPERKRGTDFELKDATRDGLPLRRGGGGLHEM
jgi:hypothetical protein